MVVDPHPRRQKHSTKHSFVTEFCFQQGLREATVEKEGTGVVGEEEILILYLGRDLEPLNLRTR